MRRIIRLFSKVLQAIKTLYYRIIYLEYKHMYDIPKDFRFNGDGILMYGDGIISIGQNSYIGRYSEPFPDNRTPFRVLYSLFLKFAR